MTKTGKHVDWLRLIGIIVLFLGIIYFYTNLFFPAHIPFIIKFGIIGRPMNILVIGTDLDTNAETGKIISESGRSDSIMVLHVDPLVNRLNIVSIPRDSYVAVPGFGYNKINAAFVLGGISLTKATIEKLLDIPIDKYLIVNTATLPKLVDLLGGVLINVDKDMFYIDRAQGLFINLKAGWQRLSGKQAEEYVRFRHDALGDLGRIERQQKFLNALSSRLASFQSIIKAPFIINLIRVNVKSDLSLKGFIMLANNMRMMPKNNFRSITLPGDPGNNAAGSVILLNMDETRKIIENNF
ncbi:LCP family protein [Candidatus Saganbacteria bacterium]|nr:LCP family protein [Candidatus Saganbacteria bacterium]